MDKAQYDGTISSNIPYYYVSIRNEIIKKLSGTGKDSDTLREGMLITAKEFYPDNSLRIKIDDNEWENSEWKCPKAALIPVSTKVWHFLATVHVPKERVKLATDKQLCQNANNLMPDTKVHYYPDGNVNSPDEYKAVIKYIGFIPEISPGIHFIIDLLEKPESPLPTSNIAKKYVPSVANPIITNLSQLRLFKNDLSESKPMNNVKQNNHHDIEASLTKELNSFVNSTTHGKKNQQNNVNNYKKDNQSSILDDSNNNNNSDSRMNEALIPKVLHQSTKSKIVTNHDGNNLSKSFSNLDIRAFDNFIEKNDINQMVKKNNGDILHVGSQVEVFINSELRYGVIRWIGTLPGSNPGKEMAGIELTDGIHPKASDGIYNDIKLFSCKQNCGIFTPINNCKPSNLLPIDNHLMKLHDDDFEEIDNSVITGIVRPICVKGDVKRICGKSRGIQGHHNSCYLDATLFSMFAFTSVFDSLLFRPRNEKDCSKYEEVQRVLREEIVNPLRKNKYVKADRVMKLRKLLEELSSVSGLTSEEKDPEEFLTSLVAQILNAEPFLKLSSGQDAYHYQLFVEKDDKLIVPTVQQLLEQSFLASNIRLKEVPSCLIIQMPRFGKSYKMYSKIQPTLLLDVTDIIENIPRQCTVCGLVAVYECRECYGLQNHDLLESTAYCQKCFIQVHHQHQDKAHHSPKTLQIPPEYIALEEHCQVPRLYLELSAVVCIETSHYVSFVKCGPGSEAPWCFFDSMADRQGEQNGYNIPEMVPCPDLSFWLSEEGASCLQDLDDDRKLSEPVKRLLCDAYMCMYQSPDVMMYQ